MHAFLLVAMLSLLSVAPGTGATLVMPVLLRHVFGLLEQGDEITIREEFREYRNSLSDRELRNSVQLVSYAISMDAEKIGNIGDRNTADCHFTNERCVHSVPPSLW